LRSWLRQFTGIFHLFTMNAFDPVLWTLITWFLVELIQTDEERSWRECCPLAH
jgi:hypothetical protein